MVHFKCSTPSAPPIVGGAVGVLTLTKGCTLKFSTPSVPLMLSSAEEVPRLINGALWVHRRKPGISTKGVL